MPAAVKRRTCAEIKTSNNKIKAYEKVHRLRRGRPAIVHGLCTRIRRRAGAFSPCQRASISAAQSTRTCRMASPSRREPRTCRTRCPHSSREQCEMALSCRVAERPGRFVNSDCGRSPLFFYNPLRGRLTGRVGHLHEIHTPGEGGSDAERIAGDRQPGF